MLWLPRWLNRCLTKDQEKGLLLTRRKFFLGMAGLGAALYVPQVLRIAEPDPYYETEYREIWYRAGSRFVHSISIMNNGSGSGQWLQFGEPLFMGPGDRLQISMTKESISVNGGGKTLLALPNHLFGDADPLPNKMAAEVIHSPLNGSYGTAQRDLICLEGKKSATFLQHDSQIYFKGDQWNL